MMLVPGLAEHQVLTIPGIGDQNVLMVELFQWVAKHCIRKWLGAICLQLPLLKEHATKLHDIIDVG